MLHQQPTILLGNAFAANYLGIATAQSITRASTWSTEWAGEDTSDQPYH